MSEISIAAVVLAAGKGTRMYSEKPKVLQTLLHEPMLYYVYSALESLFGNRILTVVGHGSDYVEAHFPERKDSFIMQEEQLGTGHALQVAWDAVKQTKASHCLVINGDTPLVTEESLARLTAVAEQTDVAFMTITPKDVGAFGRVVYDASHHVRAIVEAKDYNVAEHGQLSGEVNAGIYLFRIDAVDRLLHSLGNENASGEYYITDIVAAAVAQGLVVEGVQCGDDLSLMGINCPRELVCAEDALRRKLVNALLDKGVLVHNPDTVRVGPKVSIEPGVEIDGNCEIYGISSIKKGVRLGAYNHIVDSSFEAGCEVKQFCHIENAEIGAHAVVGPYARLRPGAILKQSSRVGNFVEMKKAVLGEGSKASHLTYLGDTEVGAGANIGAGTITCNYDGKNKFKTIIGDGAFIGSNSSLVAPVTIGCDALVGAGSTITHDVPDEGAGIARGRQKNITRRLKKSD